MIKNQYHIALDAALEKRAVPKRSIVTCFVCCLMYYVYVVVSGDLFSVTITFLQEICVNKMFELWGNL